MSNQAVGTVYQTIIDEVINTSRVDFEESGVEESVLEELRQFRSSWSVDPKTGVYSGIPSPTGIQGDPALTSYGIVQSKEMGQHLMTLDPKVDKVYSSPFYRCLQTMTPFMELQQQKAQAAARSPQTPPASGDASGPANGESLLPSAPAPAPAPAHVHAPVTKMLPEHGIREWFGSAPFDHPEPAAPRVLKNMFPSYDQEYVSVVTPSKRGETLEQLQDRITKALRGIIEQCDADGSRAVVLCSHAAVIIMIGRILTGQFPARVDMDDFKAYTCGLSVYGRSDCKDCEDGKDATAGDSFDHGCRCPPSESDTVANLMGGWICHLNSDCSFLSGGPERGWKFSGDESFPDTGSLSEADAASKL
ncbi:hypothetical protein E4U43_006944 [Claviceps pusilla]|uniref:Uncharacterized protein n=1 Tax=Claviceps pusilla TaxID=123648 RepID=A0A9P7NDD3_9HYPO|nr:hypothetical protein E4U43_006944 [Claviceps pusilla]